MAIYDTIVLGPTQTGMQMLPAGNLGIYGFTIQPLAGIMFSLLQIAQTEDFSIRAWFSTKAAGESIVNGTNRVIAIDRRPITWLVYDVDTPMIIPDGVFALPVEAGAYVLNFLNLVNSENIFSFKAAPYKATS